LNHISDSENTGRMSQLKQLLPSGRKMGFGFLSLVLVGVAALSGSLIENLDASHVMVIQKVDGTLDCYTEPGPKWQGLGNVTTYPRRGTYKFDIHDEAKKIDEGKGLQFNDGGTGKLYGAINWQMPIDCKQIIAIQKDFGSSEGIESRGVLQMVKTAINLSGMTMTSMESFAERKAELFEFINDQAQNGAYQMVTKPVECDNPITGKPEKAMVAEVVRDKAGKPLRQHGSILEQYGITLQPLAIDKLDYSDVVKEQIKARQDALTKVTVSQAKAAASIQDAITYEKDGQAAAAKTKWAQEAVKATEVTKAEQLKAVAILTAEQERDVARLQKDAAEFYRQQQILRGEGDAAYRQKVMQANGALEQKLEAYTTVMGKFATEFGKQKWVPEVQMGGSGATGANSVSQMIESLNVPVLKQLGLDMKMSASRGGDAPVAAPAAPPVKK
jgi:hypothetical protein